jgi:hypothetical protein
MQLSTLCIVASLSLALAGPGCALTTADSYRKAGAAYFTAGQFGETLNKAYQQVVGLKPHDTDAYRQLGEALSRLGMNTDAAGAFEKSEPTSGNGASTAAPMPAATLYAQNTTPQARPQPSATNGQLKHGVGERVDYVSNGVWYKAVIIKVRDDSADHLDGKLYAPYRVHPLGDNGNTDTWVCCADFSDRRSQLRPAGSNPTEPVSGGEANDEVLKALRGDPNSAVRTSPAFGYVSRTTPAPKQYHCVYFVGDHLVDAAAFKITGDSTYTDSEGKRGTFNFASPTLTFHGGNYDGQRAEYETSGGRPQVHILGSGGRRVIDCE